MRLGIFGTLRFCELSDSCHSLASVRTDVRFESLCKNVKLERGLPFDDRVMHATSLLSCCLP